MFRCHFCNQITPPKTTRHSVIIEVREKQYTARKRAPKRRGFRDRDRDDGMQDRGGKGCEIMKEVDACPACAAKQHEVKSFAAETPVVPQDVAEQVAGEATEGTTAEAAATEAATEAPAEAETASKPSGE